MVSHPLGRERRNRALFLLRTIYVLRTRRFRNGGLLQIHEYDILVCMSELLEQAIRRLRQLPEPMQESAARAVIRSLTKNQTSTIAKLLTLDQNFGAEISLNWIGSNLISSLMLKQLLTPYEG